MFGIETSTENDDETSTLDQSCAKDSDQLEAEDPKEDDPQVIPRSLSQRPRRQAAIDGEALRRHWTGTSNV